jgi:hypothetical protein
MKSHWIWNLCGLAAGCFVILFWLSVLTPMGGGIRYSATVFLVAAVLSIVLSLTAGLRASKYWYLVTGLIVLTLLVAMIGSQ